MAAPTANDFVRIHTLVRLFADETARCFMIFGMRVMPPTSTSSFTSRSESFRVFQTGFDRRNRPLNQIVGQLLQFGPGQLFSECVSDRSRPP